MRHRLSNRHHRDLSVRRRAQQHERRAERRRNENGDSRVSTSQRQHARPEHAAALNEAHILESGLTGEVGQHQHPRRAHRARAPPGRPKRSDQPAVTPLIVPRSMAARLLSVSTSTLIRMEQAGTLTPLKLTEADNAQTFYRLADLERLAQGGDHAE